MFARVMVGFDGRPAAQDALALARLLVQPDGRLMPTRVRTNRGAPHSEPALQAPTDIDDPPDLATVVASSVANGLHHAARDIDADLLVVGSSSRGHAGRVLLGSATRAVLRGAPCPIAVAPRGYASVAAGIDTIGVGYDGSPSSQGALELARVIADAHRAEIYVLQVVPLTDPSHRGFAGIAWLQAMEKMIAAAERRLAALAGVHGEVVVGLAREELQSLEDRVDLLVVGSTMSRRRRAIKLGGTETRLAAHATGALLIAPGRTATVTPGTPSLTRPV